MNIVIDEDKITAIQDRLDRSLDREAELLARYEAAKKEADRNRLMTIQETCEYLRCDEDSLLYYRKLGLDYIKKSRQTVRYLKGDVDDWLMSGYVTRKSRPAISRQKKLPAHA